MSRTKNYCTLLILIAVMIAIPVSCSNKLEYIKIRADWPYYETAEDLINASDVVFKGTITEINYKIIDYKYGKEVENCNGDFENKMLFTVYYVNPIEVYKGDNEGAFEITVIGGRSDRDAEKQLKVMKNSGLSKEYSGIPVLSGKQLLPEENSEYIFCITQSGDFYSPANIDQSIVTTDSEFGKELQTAFSDHS